MIEDRGNANLGIEADGFEHSLFGQEAGPRKVYQFCGAEPNLDIARLNEALADPIQAPPNLWTESQLWQAYAALEKTKVKGAGGRRILTDLVSLVRFAIHQDNELIPFPERVQANFNAWVEAASRRFNDNNKRQDAASTDGNQRRDAASTEGAASVPIVVGDSLAADPGERFDLILANPPFRKKSGTTIVGEGGKVSKERDTVERDDFLATTSNKQLTNSSGKNLNSRLYSWPRRGESQG